MIVELLKAQSDHLKAGFKAISNNIGPYPDLDSKVSVPAVWLELEDLLPSDDKGTEQLHFLGRFKAYCVYDRTKADADSLAAELAISVALSIMKARKFGFNADVGPAKIGGVGPEMFKPELAGFAVWAVEWTHALEFGDNVWDGEGVTPSEVWLGYSPDIGAAHKDEYEQVGEVPSA